MLHLEKATIADIKSLFKNRLLYTRCGDIRFEIAKNSFINSCEKISNKLSFEILVNDKSIMIENTTQI